MITQAQMKELWEHIEDIKVGMLTSQTGNQLHARPMHNVQDEFHGQLYFFTRMDSEKTDEINQHPQVCISYADADDDTYVSFTGTARIKRDQALINKYWNAFTAAWFPEGKDSPQVGLVEIDVQKAELWDTDKGTVAQLYQIAKANVTNTIPDMGENKKFG